jgi:protein-S-isoprenylcysteine O-methyltransferase Ste14
MADSEAAAPRRADTPGVVAPPPLIYLAGLGIGFVLEALLPSASLPAAVTVPVGTVLVLAGVALASSFVRAFRRAHTPVAPYEPTTALVTGGPYRLSRNPGYLGMALAYVGIAALASAVWVLVPLPVVLAVIDRGVIRREESYLDRRFGGTYRRYRSRTRRWL